MEPPIHIPQSLRSLSRVLIDVMFPRSCRVCDLPLAGHESSERLTHWLCRSCLAGFKRIEPPFCSVCGEVFDGAADSAFQCTNCTGMKLAFEFAIAAFKADGAVLELIHQFKYGHDLTLRLLLARMLEQVLSDSRLKALPLDQWLLVPVPLHSVREREREFNQCRELCRVLSRRCGIPMLDAMLRTRPTPKQSQLTRVQRLENLRGAFEMRSRYSGKKSGLRGRSVLLVDDVFTTGATTNECARVLKREAGVEKVVVISVARG
jgi:ComF family protein